MTPTPEENTRRIIGQWKDKLDDIAIHYEAKWGIGNLYDFAHDDLREKWDRQSQKFIEAVNRNDLAEVETLAHGTMRGWMVLEAHATAQGRKPITPEYMEVALESGFCLRIAKNQTEARCLAEQGVYVWSLSEIAKIIEKEYTLVNILGRKEREENIKKRATMRPFKEDTVPF